MSECGPTCQGSSFKPTVWEEWTPKERGVLCFLIEDEKVLLIHKKRGLGAGLVNGPGGRIEKGETALQAAIRETIEEVGITPLSLRKAGELYFQFTDGYSLHCTVFRADGYKGNIIETDEADPFWCSLSKIPFEQMWVDDTYWFEHLISEKYFKGYFEFEGNTMLSCKVLNP